MNLQNIANLGRIIYLFEREHGKLVISEDKEYYPYFYEPAGDGKYLTYDDRLVNKRTCQHPADIKKMRSTESYSSDIRYVINYITDKVPQLDKCLPKYLFIDIEVLADEMPDVNTAKYPISCISIYDSSTEKITSFYLGDYDSEKTMLDSFVLYLIQTAPDVIMAWNVDFDYCYLHNRIPDFAERISPIKATRFSHIENIDYPCGISILDYLLMFKKVNLRENSYKLDSVAEKHLGYGKKYKEVNFSKLTDEIKYRNREDVELLVSLEKKFRILDYFNEIRTFTKCLWEDLTHNSMILDSLFIQEAKNREIVLPTATKISDEEEQELEGAYRRSESGVYENIYKADVASMYPSQLVNFCLDSSNITDDTDNAVNINGVLFRQDKKALLPYLTKKLMNIKDSLKKDLKAIALDNTEHKVLQMKYDAYKGLVNSIYGVTAFSSFRLYDYKVASSITFLARDLLHFVEDEMKIRGYKVIYTDTDALMYSADEDKIELLNDLVQQWGRKYGKDSIDIMFESEGKFEKLLILGRTHYYGYLLTSKGVKKEIKGIEMKRSSSSKYEAYFQEQLIEKVLNKIPSNLIKAWIESEKESIKTKDIEELSYPCKIAVKKYKNLPVFMRAYENTKNLTKNFKLNKGEGFYYIYIHSIGCDKNNRAIDVLAFTKENKNVIDKTRINWKEMIDRSIDNKVNKVFSAIGITQITEEVLF